MSTVLDELLVDVRSLEGDADEQFETLARQIHSGQKPPASKVLDVLRAAGKTKEDLAAFVRLLESRDEMRGRIAERVRLAEREAELRELVERENEKLEAAVAKHQAACAPLQNELNTIQGWRMSNLHNDEHELFVSCPCPSLKGQHAFLTAQHRTDHATIRAIQDRLERQMASRGSHDYRTFPATRKEVEDRINRLTAELSDARAKAAETQAELVVVAEKMREW